MEISASARCQEDKPLRLTFPYSVTTQWVLALVSVTTEPSAREGLIREAFVPSFFSKVEEQQIKLFPPFERYAPSTKSSCPPAPEI